MKHQNERKILTPLRRYLLAAGLAVSTAVVVSNLDKVNPSDLNPVAALEDDREAAVEKQRAFRKTAEELWESDNAAFRQQYVRYEFRTNDTVDQVAIDMIGEEADRSNLVVKLSDQVAAADKSTSEIPPGFVLYLEQSDISPERVEGFVGIVDARADGTPSERLE